jgi:CBS domain-containing protein
MPVPKLVKDLMIPLEEYATVSQNDTLYDAVIALEQADRLLREGTYRHRAVLVLDESNHIVGKLSQLDFLKALESRYQEIIDTKSLNRFGLSASFVKSMITKQGLWQKPLDNICSRAPHIKVKDVMYTPEEGEYVEENASFDEAIHQLIMGHHQSLLVTRGSSVVGVLRLTDVFTEVYKLIKDCGPAE